MMGKSGARLTPADLICPRSVGLAGCAQGASGKTKPCALFKNCV